MVGKIHPQPHWWPNLFSVVAAHVPKHWTNAICHWGRVCLRAYHTVWCSCMRVHAMHFLLYTSCCPLCILWLATVHCNWGIFSFALHTAKCSWLRLYTSLNSITKTMPLYFCWQPPCWAAFVWSECNELKHASIHDPLAAGPEFHCQHQQQCVGRATTFHLPSCTWSRISKSAWSLHYTGGMHLWMLNNAHSIFSKYR